MKFKTVQFVSLLSLNTFVTEIEKTVELIKDQFFGTTREELKFSVNSPVFVIDSISIKVL